MPSRIIFHADVNSAFLSWEAVFRLEQGETLDLRTVPSAVGGDVKSRHGIITAKSIPAKAYGIATAETVASALKKCPNLILVPSTPGLYSKCSRAFMEICREFSPCVEPFSVDECFLDMTTVVPGKDQAAAEKLANELKDRVRDELGFTINVGISENKLLAKTASDFKKPDRVHTLWREEIPKKLWPLPVGDLLFVGRSSAERLKTLGIRTIGELAQAPVEMLKAHVGEKSALYMNRAANGIDLSPVSDIQAAAKGYGHSTTLSEDVTEAGEAYPVLLSLTEAVCRRLRKDSVKAGQVTVTYRSNDFVNRSRQHKLDTHTFATDLIYREVKRIFDELWDKKTPIRLLGVSCGNLSDGSNEQLNLFGDEEKEKKEKLDLMLDSIKNRFGENSIKRGSLSKGPSRREENNR